MHIITSILTLLQEEVGEQIPLFDYLWHLRCAEEFGMSTVYEQHTGQWKRVYCESRVENYLCAGGENVPEVNFVASLQ